MKGLKEGKDGRKEGAGKVGGVMSATCAKVIPNICKMREKGNSERGKEEKRKKKGRSIPLPKKNSKAQNSKSEVQKSEKEK